MILAAGKGTRLKPFTDTMPKALFPVNGIPLLEIILKKLYSFGTKEIIINTHHFQDIIVDFLKLNDYFNLNIQISEESELLETGGGLKKVSWFFNGNDPFIVHNVDILSDINFNELVENHCNNKSLATLAVTERTSSRYFLFDNNLELKGWKNLNTGSEKVFSMQSLQNFAFSGIQVLSPEIFSLMPNDNIFSLTDLYLQLCTKNRIKAFIHNSNHWKDVGKAEEWLKQ